MMKVLWVCTSPLGPMAKLLGINYGGYSGGWITSEYEKLKNSGIDIAFLTMHSSVNKAEIIQKENNGEKIFCICAPKPTFGIDIPEWMRENIYRVYRDYDPDIIHIWGTESVLTHTAAICKSRAKKLIFLQGILGIHIRYKKQCLEGDAVNSAYYRLTESIKRRLYIKQACLEAKSLSAVDGIILDNDFSQAYCSSLNPNLKFIRYRLLPKQCFFDAQNSKIKKEPFSIFTVAGNSPMKGLHMLLRAVAELKNKYPNIKLYIPGNFSDELKNLGNKSPEGYEKLLYNIIKKSRIESNVIFCGCLTPEKMAEKMSECSVFVNPSCMEVHALSLREAMAAGLPCISTVCGSVAEFLRHGENGFLFRYGEYEVCAYYLSMIFDDPELSKKLSSTAADTWSLPSDTSLLPVYSHFI